MTFANFHSDKIDISESSLYAIICIYTAAAAARTSSLNHWIQRSMPVGDDGRNMATAILGYLFDQVGGRSMKRTMTTIAASKDIHNRKGIHPRCSDDDDMQREVGQIITFRRSGFTQLARLQFNNKSTLFTADPVSFVLTTSICVSVCFYQTMRTSPRRRRC